jgi:NhaA family Na+:H+ antiporter
MSNLNCAIGTINSMGKKPKIIIESFTQPVQRFIQQEKSGGIVLGISVVLALILANSPWSDSYFHLFEHKLGVYFDGRSLLEYSLHEWVNDGLMAVFFFVVGLELKREIIGGELSSPRKAALPIAAAIGGMLVPALIYFSFNSSIEVRSGWGIPMATDIAFALGVLYLLGNRVPLGLKVFLTALAIVDDLGAVLVIALFYTSEISIANLSVGIALVGVMYGANKLGIRSILFYSIVGIAGVWTAFLLSGIHATIAAVLAAFTIPADVILKEDDYISKNRINLDRFRSIDADNSSPSLTAAQLHVLERIKNDTNAAIPPLQRLEHAMHPMVTFIILPIFALANAGVNLSLDLTQLFSTNVIQGVSLGLLLGKPIGIVAFTYVLVKLRFAPFPTGMNLQNLIGLGFLAGIGFTMSLFVTSLAFDNETYMTQAKIGIFSASLLSGIVGYIVLMRATKKP